MLRRAFVHLAATILVILTVTVAVGQRPAVLDLATLLALQPTSTSIIKSATSTILTSNLNPSVYGQSVTLTAMVAGTGSISPSGTVAFTWSDLGIEYTLGTASLNSAGVATLTKSNLNADSYPITAVYSGDTSNLGSSSATLILSVTQTTSSASLTSTPNPSNVGQSVTYSSAMTSPTV
jgi:hypothetical protein